MIPGACFVILRCVMYVLSTSALGASEEIVLMMVRQGNNVNIESVWNQTGNTYPADLNPLLTVEQLIPLSLVRSTYIDDWGNPPDQIIIRTLNDQGDILWEMGFGVPMGTGPVLRDVLVPSNILYSSSTVSPSTVDISWSKQSYQLYIGSTTGTDSAWLGVFNGPMANTSPNRYPVFLVPRISDVPPTLAIESPSSSNAVYTFEGCWPFSALTTTYGAEDIQSMTLELCAGHCRGLSRSRMLLEMGYKCHCGDFSSSPTGRDDSKCNQPCNGDTNSPYTCGGNSNMFAVYPVPDALPFKYTYEGCWGNINLNMQNCLSKSYMTVTMCNNVCTPKSTPLFIIQGGQNCYCGSFTNTNPNDRDDSMCVTSCAGSTTFEPCGGNGRGAVYRTGSGIIIQDLPSTHLGSSNVTRTVPYSAEIMVNVSSMTGFAVTYVTSLYVESSANNQGQYDLYYSTYDCDSSSRTPHIDANDTLSVFLLAVHEEVDTLPVHCVWIVFPISVGPDPMFIQISFLNEEMYILPTYFAITGVWDTETTTNSATQTVTPVVTSEVTTEVTGVTTEVTTEVGQVTTTVTEVTTDVGEVTTTVTGVTTDVGQVTTTVHIGTTGVQDTAITSSGQSTTSNTMTTNQVSIVTSSSGTPGGVDCLTCSCVDHQYVNYTEEEIRDKIRYLQTQLTVNKQTLSSYKRKRSSAVDNRRSAVSLGSLGVLVIIISISLVVCSDLVNLNHFFRQKKQRAAMREKMIE